jgi:glycosyltransferase involved in cell wall biosynthesis
MTLTVMQVLPALESGGVERGTVEVARELTRRGHRAIVVSAGGRMVAELEAIGARHIAWAIGRKNPLTLNYVRPMRQLLASEHVDILHARSRLPAWIAHLAWRRLDAARRPGFLTTVHGAYQVNRYSAVMMRGERIVAISEWIREYVLSNYKSVDPARVHVIPRGVDPQRFAYGWKPGEEWRERLERQHPQLRGKQWLTTVARISRRKGLEDFIRLVARLAQDGRNVHGLIVGGASSSKRRYLQQLKQRVAADGLEPHITFLGQRDDARELMAASAIVFNLALEPEGFGRTTVEALSLGIPVIGHDHSGIREVLGRILPQGLIPTGEAGPLLERSLRFLQNPPHVPREQPYTLQAMLDAKLALYEQMAQERARR